MPELAYQRNKHPWSETYHKEQIDFESVDTLLEELTPEEVQWFKDCSAKLLKPSGEKAGFGIKSAIEFWMKVLNYWDLQDMDVEARKLRATRK